MRKKEKKKDEKKMIDLGTLKKRATRFFFQRRSANPFQLDKAKAGEGDWIL